jgi:hypothetical protein
MTMGRPQGSSNLRSGRQVGTAKIRAWSTAGSKTGAAINKRRRDDVVGAEMLQQLPGEPAA